MYADVAARWDCQEYYGYDLWFAGHRNGATGLTYPNTADINSKPSVSERNNGKGLLLTKCLGYKSAVQWIESQINSDPKYRSDDTRFYVNVPAI